MELNKPDPLDVSLKIVGPFKTSKVAVGGYKVPLLEGTYLNNGETVAFVLDGRFEIQVPTDVAEGVAWFIANALAIGDGYSHFGQGSQKSNPYQCQMVGIDGPDEQAKQFFDDDTIE